MGHMDDNPFAFSPYRGDPRIVHGSEELFSTLLWGTNIAMGILHMPSLLGFQPRKINKDLMTGISLESSAMRCLQQGKQPLWPYHRSKLDSDSVPELWWKEAQFISWKVERQ